MSANQTLHSESGSQVELNLETAGKILVQYVELAQQKGSYLLNEASLLKRAMDVVNGNQDAEVNTQTAYTLLVQGVVKGQKHGAYTLSDAAILDKIVNYLVTPPATATATATATAPATATDTDTTSTDTSNPVVHHTQASQKASETSEQNDEDLEELTAPVPLKASPKEI